MKRAIFITLGVGFAGLVVFTMYFLYKKSETKPVVWETTTPLRTDIIKKTVATGSIVPREEIEIKTRVPGVISEIMVEPGQAITRGELIARIELVPDMVTLNRSEAEVRTARIRSENAVRELERHEKLFGQKVISEAELTRARLEHDLARQELATAQSNLQLIKEGSSGAGGKVSNEVHSTVDGMVLQIPVEVGDTVTESNNFREGTTIAFIANMSDMIFQGLVDESEVGKIEEGMPLQIKIGALEGQLFDGTLEHIAPKGIEQEGAIQFEIKAAIQRKEGVFIRAGYSANADIVLERRDDVLALDESVLQFDGGKPYVEVAVGEQVFERRDVEVGLSDGIHIEVLSGVDESTPIKKIQPGAGPRRRGR